MHLWYLVVVGGYARAAKNSRLELELMHGMRLTLNLGSRQTRDCPIGAILEVQVTSQSGVTDAP